MPTVSPKNGIKEAVVLLFKMTSNWIYVSELLFKWFDIECQEIGSFLHNSFKTVKYEKKNKSIPFWSHNGSSTTKDTLESFTRSWF